MVFGVISPLMDFYFAHKDSLSQMGDGFSSMDTGLRISTSARPQSLHSIRIIYICFNRLKKSLFNLQVIGWQTDCVSKEALRLYGWCGSGQWPSDNCKEKGERFEERD